LLFLRGLEPTAVLLLPVVLLASAFLHPPGNPTGKRE
jgi:hypothetical protein